MVSQLTVVDGDLTPELLAAFRASDRVAWDIETSGLDWHNDRIGTCQLHAPDVGTVLVKVRDEVPCRLASLLEDDKVVKVFHHAPFDLKFMSHYWNVRARSVMCTKIASRLSDSYAKSDSHSLKDILQRYLGVELDKTQRTSDWLAVKLSQAQVEYAAADVLYLLPLLARLELVLKKRNKEDLFKECCDFLPAQVELETSGWKNIYAY